jgi:predicted nuclease with TOPRIM domain
MKSDHSVSKSILLFVVIVAAATPCFAGVSRAIQDRYRKEWENKALFLKIPIYGEKALVHITGRTFRAEEGTGTARFKVGDQLRILGLDFSNEEIRFKMGQVASAVGVAEVVFRFDSNLLENFPNSDVFEKALQSTFTEGLKFTDIEDAKRGYVEDQFDRTVREMAETSGTNREAVLKAIAPRVPAYQDAVKDLENLKSRNQDLTGQLSQTQSDNRKLEGELRNQVSEVNRLRKENTALSEKIDSSSAQLGKLGEEIRNVRGLTQSYQKEIANVQRTLNMKVDANRDMGSQIADLGQLLQKLQKDNSALDSQNNSLRQNLENQQTANNKLLGENDDLKSANAKMKDTIGTLTSKEDSLARQYLQVKQNRDNLENLALAVQNLNTRLLEENTEGGIYTGKFNMYLREVLLGSLTLRVPDALASGQEKTGEAEFLSESVDYVKLSADERHILRSLGDKLKLQVKLASIGDAIAVAPEKGDATQEIGERDRATWRWKITNKGTQDARVFLAARLINKNSDEIPLLEEEHLVKSSNVVRQVRNFLQPIPMTIGAVIGFLLFGIVSVFRRKGPRVGRKDRGVANHDSATYVGQKRL